MLVILYLFTNESLQLRLLGILVLPDLAHNQIQQQTVA